MEQKSDIYVVIDAGIAGNYTCLGSSPPHLSPHLTCQLNRPYITSGFRTEETVGLAHHYVNMR